MEGIRLLQLCILIITLIYTFSLSFAQEKPEIFPQLGHSSSINVAVFSADGKYLFSAGDDKLVKMWDVYTGKEIRTFKDSYEITAIAISPDNRLILTGNQEGQIKLWDIFSGELISTFDKEEESTSHINSLSFSSDGMNAISTDGHELIFWSIESRKPLFKLGNMVLLEGGFDVNYAIFSPDEKYIIMGVKVVNYDENGEIYTGLKIEFFDMFNKKVTKSFALKEVLPGYENEETIESFSLSKDQKYLLVSISKNGNEAGKLYVFDISKGRIIKKFIGPEEDTRYWYSSTAISGDGKYAAAGRIGEVLLFDAQKWEVINKFDARGPVVFSPDNNYFVFGNFREPDLVYGGFYQKFGLDFIDLKTNTKLKRFSGKIVDQSILWYSNNTIITKGERGELFYWDLQKGERINSFYLWDEFGRALNPIAISDNGKYIVATNMDDGRTYIFDTTENKLKKILDKPADGASFSSDDKLLLLSYDKKVVLWSVDKNIIIKTLVDWTKNKDIDYIEEIFLAQDLKKFLIVYKKTKYPSDENAIMPIMETFAVFNFQNGLKISEFDFEDTPGFAVSPNIDHLLFGFYNGTLELRDIHGELINRFEEHHNDIVSPLSFSKDGKFILSGSFDHDIILWETESGKKIKTFIGHAGIIWSFYFPSDNKNFLSTSGDGTVRLWDINSGKEIAQFISFTDGEWVIITPEGYFNTSPNGAKHLNVRVGNSVYSIDNFYEKFFNPVYVASVLQGKKVEAVADIRKGILTPPDVRIISPEPGATFSTDTITVTVSARDTGGGIDEIRLYHNGKAVGEDQRGIKLVSKGNEIIKTYTVTLVDGINTFRAVGFSKDRTESNPYELTVKLTAPQKEVSLYVLAVGINNYKNPALNLNYAEPDARGIVEFFKEKGKRLFKKVESIELYNEKATKENIVSELKKLQATSPQDAVLIYLAGHGENISDKWYLIPHELTYPEREEEVKTKGISSDELAGLIRNIRAQKILVLIDACKSGAVLVAFRGFEDRKALSQLSRSTGVHVIAASSKDQLAAEVKELGHGVFTYTILEGLKGKASGGTGTVTVFKLKAYLDEQLPEITKKYKQEVQYPVGVTSGMDFPLVLIK